MPIRRTRGGRSSLPLFAPPSHAAGLKGHFSERALLFLSKLLTFCRDLAGIGRGNIALTPLIVTLMTTLTEFLTTGNTHTILAFCSSQEQVTRLFFFSQSRANVCSACWPRCPQESTMALLETFHQIAIILTRRISTHAEAAPEAWLSGSPRAPSCPTLLCSGRGTIPLRIISASAPPAPKPIPTYAVTRLSRSERVDQPSSCVPEE